MSRKSNPAAIVPFVALLGALWIPPVVHGIESDPQGRTGLLSASTECAVTSLDEMGMGKGTYMANLWTSHVVPYDYTEDSGVVVNSYTGTDVQFVDTNPPVIVCDPTAFLPEWVVVGDEILVSGSVRNDNSAGQGYVITATTATTIELRPTDSLQDELAGANVTISSTTSVTAPQRAAFEEAVLEWEAVADIDFVRRTSQTDYVLVRNSNRNRSDVGQRGTGAQDLQMRAWGSKFVIVHELGHTLGVKHEQSRTDRGLFVQIIGDNVIPEFIANFYIVTDSDAYPITPHAIYDFDSVMHYGRDAFTINGQDTIVVRPPWDVEWQTKIGQRTHLSKFDSMTMSFLYPEADWKFLYASAPSTDYHGTFHDPYTTFGYAESRTPAGGRLIILYPDEYDAVGVYGEAKLLQAPIGGALLH